MTAKPSKNALAAGWSARAAKLMLALVSVVAVLALAAIVLSTLALTREAQPAIVGKKVRLDERPDGGLLVEATDVSSGKVRPVLMLTGTGDSSVAGRTGLQHVYEKAFLHGHANESTPDYLEFLEFREDPDGMQLGLGKGVGGFLLDERRDDLVEWAENFHPISLATQSESRQNVGGLATRRITVGASQKMADVPITVSDAWLQFDSGSTEATKSNHIRLTGSDAMLSLVGGNSSRSGAGLKLYGRDAPGKEGRIALTSPGPRGQPRERLTVSGVGTETHIALREPAVAQRGISVENGSYLQLTPHGGRPDKTGCATRRDLGRVSLGNEGATLYVCAGAPVSWRKAR